MFLLWVSCDLLWDHKAHCREVFWGWGFLFNYPYVCVVMCILQCLLRCSASSKGQLAHFINSVYAFRCFTMPWIPLKLRAYVYLRRNQCMFSVSNEVPYGKLLRHRVEKKVAWQWHHSIPQDFGIHLVTFHEFMYVNLGSLLNLGRGFSTSSAGSEHSAIIHKGPAQCMYCAGKMSEHQRRLRFKAQNHEKLQKPNPLWRFI